MIFIVAHIVSHSPDVSDIVGPLHCESHLEVQTSANKKNLVPKCMD
jgi:hypothetical protein